jgi:glycopeptide antibiotics resistance protein
MRLVLYGLFVMVGLAAFGLGAALAARRIANPEKRRRRLARRELLAASIAAILAVTMVPTHHESVVELVPFTYLSLLAQLGNVLLFVPLGAVLCFREWSLRRASLAGLALSSAIEIIQLAIPGRATATEDVILNVLGLALGWLVATRIWRDRRTAERLAADAK